MTGYKGSVFRPRQRTVATIGYPGHGKTIFLASLFWDSFFRLSETLQDKRQPYAVRALTEDAIKVFFGNAETLQNLELPPPNPRAQPGPATLEFQGVPSAHGRRRRRIWLTFYDIAGEVFRDAASTQQYAPFITRADDVIFLFDPTRPDFSAISAAQLVDRVSLVAERRERKNLIVALSKMDELRARDEWVNLLADFWPDTPPRPADLHDYFRAMEYLSDQLRGWWLDEARQARNLINSLPKSTRFCALSSLGHRPLPDAEGRLRLSERPQPFRVRDPLFWIFRAARVM
jgi:hypothetical protein